MQMPPYFFRVMKDIKHICQTYNAMSTWEFPRIRKKEFAGQLVHNNGTNFGVIVDKFQMKPTMSSDTGMLIKSTTILAEVPANSPSHRLGSLSRTRSLTQTSIRTASTLAKCARIGVRVSV